MPAPSRVSPSAAPASTATAPAPSIVITYPFALSQSDGGTRMTCEIARHLVQRGARVTVMPVCTNGLSRTFPRKPLAAAERGQEFAAALERDGIRVVAVEQNPLKFELDGLAVRKAMKTLLDEQPVTDVITWFREGAFLPRLLKARGIHFHVMAAMQSYHFLTTARSPLRKLSNRMLLRQPHRKAEIVFVPSEYSRDEVRDLIGIDPDRLVVCTLGVDPAFFEIPRPDRGTITRILFFGRLVWQKGFTDALQALGMLAQRGLRDWRLRMVGNGRHKEAHAMARELGIGDLVETHEAVDDEGIRRELAEADLALLPSRREAFGLAFAEAQAAGIPVVGYHTCAVPEVVEDGVTGWLAPYPGPEGLADRLQQAIADPERTYHAGLQARERVRRLFHWDRTAQVILDALQRSR